MTQPPRTIDFYFSFISLWSYIGSLPLRELAQRHALDIRYKPMNLIDVFAVSGGKPVKERAPQRQAYRLVEMQRWSAIRQIPLVLHPRFYPADPSLGHRMLLAAQARGERVDQFAHLALRAVWADELDIANPDTLVALADAAGLDGRRLLADAADPAIARQEDQLQQEALQRQVFGAPFYFYRDEPFWGQDRLDLLEDAIVSGRAPIVTPGADAPAQ